MKSEDIRNRQWTEGERQVLRRVARRQTAGDDSRVYIKDIPRLSDEQLASMVRLRDARPRKVAVSIRLDPQVLNWLKSKGEGHLTRINDILCESNGSRAAVTARQVEQSPHPARSFREAFPLVTSAEGGDSGRLWNRMTIGMRGPKPTCGE